MNKTTFDRVPGSLWPTTRSVLWDGEEVGRLCPAPHPNQRYRFYPGAAIRDDLLWLPTQICVLEHTLEDSQNAVAAILAARCPEAC